MNWTELNFKLPIMQFILITIYNCSKLSRVKCLPGIPYRTSMESLGVSMEYPWSSMEFRGVSLQFVWESDIKIKQLIGCLPFTKIFRKILLESKWNTTCWVVPSENSREQRSIWKGSPVFPNGIFQTEIRVPFLQSHLWYRVLAFAVVLLVNGTDLYEW